jgi:ABC-type amino acid transport substrate-binding protein
VTYAVADPGVASVDVAGRVTMLAPGTTTLTATLQGRTASLALASLAAAPGRTFHIDLRFLGSPDPSLAAAARAAAARWESVIAASPGASPVTLAAGECHTGTPAMNETVANLVIFVRLDTIDGPGGPGGNLIGSAGPCVVRHAGGLYGAPVVGVVNLDAYDLLHPTHGGTTVDVISHEIGHVLGIGTIWNIEAQREFVPGLRSGSYDYVAPQAARAAYELGFTASPTAPVPVEDQGGGGTLGSHWRERVFVSELMTGYMNFAPDPISQITIGTLADLGWTVDPAGAEPFSVLSTRSATALAAARGFSASRAAATGAGSARTTDLPLRPRLSVTRSGNMTRLPR